MPAPDLLIFESHPVQYKVPVYQELARLAPERFEVVFGTDITTRGHFDEGFGQKFAWDVPLLGGYPHRVLGNERAEALGSRGSLSGRGVFGLLRRSRPRAVLLTQLRYNFDFVAYFSALALGVPIWIRQETQDEMFSARRGRLKAWLRAAAYRLLYLPVRRAFCFGELNREHLLRHGLHAERLTMARFSVPDPLAAVDEPTLRRRRETLRVALDIPPEQTVIAFFGKLIPKKDPELIFDAVDRLPEGLRGRIRILFVGSGELEPVLRQRGEASTCAGVHFTGFVNQSALPDYYLAADVVVLPSRRMGEAWGLVVNEALQAGCAVAMTDAVGCHPEFGNLERVRVTPEGDASALAHALEDLSAHLRDFRWAAKTMERYSTSAAAEAIARELAQLR